VNAFAKSKLQYIAKHMSSGEDAAVITRDMFMMVDMLRVQLLAVVELPSQT